VLEAVIAGVVIPVVASLIFFVVIAGLTVQPRMTRRQDCQYALVSGDLD